MGDEFISRHGPETITTMVVRMRYLWDLQYLSNKIRGNYYTCTSELRNELRHKGIDVVYVGVELLYKHDMTMHGFLT